MVLARYRNTMSSSAVEESEPTRLQRFARGVAPHPAVCARCRSAAALSGLPRRGRRIRGPLRVVLVEAVSIERPFCERLGIPFIYDPGPGICSMQAIADPPAYTRARAAVRYDDVARALVHALKYGDRLDLATHAWPAGWHGPAKSCWPRPTPSCRFRCIGAGAGRGDSTSRRLCRRSFPNGPTFRSPSRL